MGRGILGIDIYCLWIVGCSLYSNHTLEISSVLGGSQVEKRGKAKAFILFLNRLLNSFPANIGEEGKYCLKQYWTRITGYECILCKTCAAINVLKIIITLRVTSKQGDRLYVYITSKQGGRIYIYIYILHQSCII